MRLPSPHPQVTTLFHETGHGLQHMLTTVPHAPAAGIGNVEWDAVELPSPHATHEAAIHPTVPRLL